MHPNVYSSIIYNNQIMEAAQVSIQWWTDKEDVRYVCVCTRACVCVCVMQYYSAIKKNQILPFATTWVDLEEIMLSEMGQMEKDKYCMISLICGM